MEKDEVRVLRCAISPYVYYSILYCRMNNECNNIHLYNMTCIIVRAYRACGVHNAWMRRVGGHLGACAATVYTLHVKYVNYVTMWCSVAPKRSGKNNEINNRNRLIGRKAVGRRAVFACTMKSGRGEFFVIEQYV